MRQAGDGRHGRLMRGLIVVLWRAGLRIHEALMLTETTSTSAEAVCDPAWKGDGWRVGIDSWAWRTWTVAPRTAPLP